MAFLFVGSYFVVQFMKVETKNSVCSGQLQCRNNRHFSGQARPYELVRWLEFSEKNPDIDNIYLDLCTAALLLLLSLTVFNF